MAALKNAISDIGWKLQVDDCENDWFRVLSVVTLPEFIKQQAYTNYLKCKSLKAAKILDCVVVLF